MGEIRKRETGRGGVRRREDRENRYTQEEGPSTSTTGNALFLEHHEYH